MLKNPFGIRNGKVIVISDLSEAERGLRCHCSCPNCNGELVARMGDIKIHHFAHTKDACDETVAFVTGLFHLIMQLIHDTGSFRAPSLVVAYHLPYTGMTKENVEQYVQIIQAYQQNLYGDSIVIAEGKVFSVNSIELMHNKKKQADALIITAKQRKLAVRILPPPDCKSVTMNPYMDLPTLVFDARDIDFHSMTSAGIKSELIDNKRRWRWISNGKVTTVYNRVYGEYQKQQEELQKIRERQKQIFTERISHQTSVYASPFSRSEQRKVGYEQVKDLFSRQETIARDSAPAYAPLFSREEQRKMGYEQVKDLFTQQETIIRDNFGNRWVQCEICGRIKLDQEFPYYGGTGRVNLGVCSLCSKTQS